MPLTRFESQPELPSLAILASGRGTTMEALADAWRKGELRARIGIVVTNNANAEVIERVKRLNSDHNLGIDYKIVNGTRYPRGGPVTKGLTDGEADKLAEVCAPFDYDLCAGYNKLLRGPLLDQIIWNHHPGPIPLTRGMMGLKAQRTVLEAGLPFTEINFHPVTMGYDEGTPLFTQQVPVWEGDTDQVLFDALQDVEKRCLIYMLNSAIHGDPYPPIGKDFSRRPPEMYGLAA